MLKTWNRPVVFAYCKSIEVRVSFHIPHSLQKLSQRPLYLKLWNPQLLLDLIWALTRAFEQSLEPRVINHAARGLLAALQPFLCPLIEHFSTNFWQAQDYQNKPKSRVTNEVLRHIFKTAEVSTEPSEIDHILM